MICSVRCSGEIDNCCSRRHLWREAPEKATLRNRSWRMNLLMGGLLSRCPIHSTKDMVDEVWSGVSDTEAHDLWSLEYNVYLPWFKMSQTTISSEKCTSAPLPAISKTPLLHHRPHTRINLLRTPRSIYLLHSPLPLEIFHNRHTRLHKSLKPLLDALLIIICSSGSLAAVQEALLHYFFGTVEE